MSLSELCRPRCWAEVIGQPRALAVLERLRKSGGLAGRAYWLAGPSGTGKTTIARLIAAEVASDFCTTELDGGQFDTAALDNLERDTRQRPFGQGACWIVNEAHGLRAPIIRRLLVLLEALPAWVTVVFTTTNDGAGKLFEDCDDASPLLSRCTELPMARRDLARAFAEHAQAVAERHNLNGQPIEKYIRLVNNHRSNLRAVLGAIEAGAMAEWGNDA